MKIAEKEYISREAAKKQMRNGCHSMEWLLASGAKTIGDVFAIILDEVPAADVQPVRRGKWIDHQEGCWIYAKCSECETVHDVRSNFCPNCGARMEES